jgi:excisionase family DNA binding protein
MRDVFGVLEGFEGQLLSLPKAAKIIGTSRQWLHKEVVAGRIPAYRIGTYYKVDPFQLAQWLMKR